MKRISRKVLLLGAMMVSLITSCCVINVGRLPMALSDASKNTRVDFYGQVVDAQGHPVAGAKISAVVTGYNPLYVFSFSRSREWDRHVEATTDAMGRFTILSYRGDGLGIRSISKPGYSWLYGSLGENDDNESFDFRSNGPSYIPDPERPAIFPLVKPGEKTAALPSRGGSQRRFDGSLVANKPVIPSSPSVPSAVPVQ